MPRYVAFFGSINVGGNRLTMADLRAAFETEGFAQVETVVASGNVLFEHPERPTTGLEEKLGLMMAERFAMRSVVAVRDRDELASAIAENPFAGDKPGAGDDARVHTMFLDGQPARDTFEALVDAHAAWGRERLALGDRSLYIDFVDGAGSTKLSGSFIERRLQCRGTARNIRSLARILAKMDEG